MRAAAETDANDREVLITGDGKRHLGPEKHPACLGQPRTVLEPILQ